MENEVGQKEDTMYTPPSKKKTIKTANCHYQASQASKKTDTEPDDWKKQRQVALKKFSQT